MLTGWATDDSADIADALRTEIWEEKQLEWYENDLTSLTVVHVASKSHQTL